MRLLHTSDWHLGRSLHGADLTEAYELWADHVVEVAKSRDVDAVLISGDVYDRGIPPVTMVELLSRTLSRLLEHTSVILTPGNHDAPKRLGFASGLLREGLHIVADALAAATPVEVKRDGEVVGLVYGLPYLDPDMERYRLSPDPEVPLERSHTGVVRGALDRVREDRATRNATLPTVVMAHAFVVGGEESESERDLTIGGVDSVAASVFVNETGVPFDYVALGHLHGPQKVGENTGVNMRYSGSPVAFSFSEENHKKSSALVEIAESGGEVSVELIPAPVHRRLATIRGTIDELLSAEFAHLRDHYIRAYVTDDERPSNMYLRLKSEFPHILECQHEGQIARVTPADIRAVQQDPLAVLGEFFNEAGGRPLDDNELEVVSKAWSEQISEDR